MLFWDQNPEKLETPQKISIFQLFSKFPAKKDKKQSHLQNNHPGGLYIFTKMGREKGLRRLTWYFNIQTLFSSQYPF